MARILVPLGSILHLLAHTLVALVFGLGCTLSAEPGESAFSGAPEEPGAPAEPDGGSGEEPEEEEIAPCEGGPASTADTLPAYLTDATIDLDGRPDEPAWQDAASVYFENKARSPNETSVWALWDETYLYLAYSVVDEKLEAVGEALHRDDGAEIYLDTGHEKSLEKDDNDYHFITNILDAYTGGEILVVTATTDYGYTQEIAIPWAEIEVAPAAGMTMGLLLGNNDRDDGVSVQYDWQDLIETGRYARPYLWGDLHLSGYVATSCAPEL